MQRPQWRLKDGLLYSSKQIRNVQGRRQYSKEETLETL